ncbi:hypothetical protein [Agromyces sp. NPDC049794]|uniref:hypothetical protein n=1 Tax=unclassified Agromyces TaxID=2639701 RepID=UPI0033E2B74D
MSGVGEAEAMVDGYVEAADGITIEPSRGVERAVLAWGRWYTLDLPGDMANDRLAELESDLFEHRAAAGGGAGVGSAILWRAVRGVPSDVSWRFSRLRRTALSAPHGTFPLALPAIAHLATAALLTWGVFVVARVTGSLLAGSWAGAWDLLAAGVAGLAIAIVGGWLVAVRRRRMLGAFWLAAASFLLIRFGTMAVVATSVTLTEFQHDSMEQFMLLVRAATLAGVLFFAAMAVWWTAAPQATDRPEWGEA